MIARKFLRAYNKKYRIMSTNEQSYMEPGRMKMKRDQEKEHKYEENIRRQLSILNALGKDYLTLCLLNIKTEKITILNTSMEEIKEGTDLPYYETCYDSIDKYVREDQKEEIKEKIDLKKVKEELSQKQEYSFIYEVWLDGQIQYYQMRYISLEDKEHILMTFRLTEAEVDKDQQKENKTVDELRKERMFLEVLCRDYTAVYYFDLKNDTLEILKMDKNANSVNMFGTQLRKKLNYSKEMIRYCSLYVIESEQKGFLRAMNRDYIREKLKDSERFVYRFESNPNLSKHRHFEVQALRVVDQEFDDTAILAFRHIDHIVADENERKKQLEEAIKMEERSKRLEKERQDAIAANEMKSRFLSSISHDIRTPINGIQGMLRIAETCPNDLKKQNECREKIWIASNYLVTLVNNVLNMNRLENKSIDLSEQSFNMIDLLMDVTGMTDIQIEAQELHSIVDWKPGYIDHRYLIGSSEGLYRILMNLTSNAIKYNKKGGTVYCRCMEKQREGDTIWFEFVTSDTGVGMDEEFLKHAFEPYIQKDNTTLSSIKGVGLGLSIVKQTVELMGGTIEVESKVGEGTKYTIMLPFKIDPNPQVKKKSLEHISLNGVKALLVEDNDLNLEIAKFHLEQENVEVYTAMNGAEAVDMFEQSEVGYYDIILMDIMMPIMDGLQATREIRKLPRPDAAAVPIIAMSANAFEEDIEKSMEAGMNAHLTKPLDGKKVPDTMKQYLASKILK